MEYLFSFGNKSFLGKITFAEEGLDVVFFGACFLSLKSPLDLALEAVLSVLGLEAEPLLIVRPRPRTEAVV